MDLNSSRYILPSLLILLLLLSVACREEQKVNVAAGLDPKKMATMSTRDISTLISDSGVIQYKIVAPLWQVFDEVDTPYWSFPQGLYLEKFDPYFHVIATVAADSARFFKEKRLWKLMGHVEMTKVPKDLFQSERVYWDQRRGQLYSDTFMHIETATHVLEGTGFISNEHLTQYRILNPEGIFPINRDDIKGGSPDTISPRRTPRSVPEPFNPADTVKAE